RQQDGHAVGAAQPREHADDGAEHDADDGHEQVERRDRDMEAEEEVFEAHRQSPSQASSGPLGMGTRNQRSKITKVASGRPRASSAMVIHRWRPTQRM